MDSYQVTCRSCGASNRIPADKEGVAGKCGSCKADLPPLYSQPQAVNAETFDRFVASYPGPVLVEFWAPW